MSLANVLLIDKNECVGNSLSSINSNFVTLTSEINSANIDFKQLQTNVAEFSAFGVSKIKVVGDYITIDPSTGIGTVTLSAGNPYSGQELISASNVGVAYGADIFKQKANRGLEFRKIVSGSTNISVSAVGDVIKITGLDSSGLALGEANSTSNVGSGVGLAKEKQGTILPFKTLVAGTGISLLTADDFVTITSTVSGKNIGGGTGILSNSTHPLEFRTIKGGKNITVSPTNNNEVLISATDSLSVVSTGAEGAFIFHRKNEAGNLVFKTLSAASPNVIIEDRQYDIHISVVNLLSGENIGFGKKVFSNLTDNTLHFKTLSAGKYVELTETADGIKIDAFVPAVSGLLGVNVGTGTTVLSGNKGFELHFKTLSAGNGIELNDDNGTLSITVKDEVIYKTINVENLGNSQTFGLYSGKSSLGTLQFKSLSSIGSAVSVTSNANSITFDSRNALINAVNSNIGTGDGTVLKENVSGVLKFKKIKAGAGIIVNNGNDDIQISSIATINNTIPVGAVMAFATRTAPAGWLVCNGEIVPKGNGTIQNQTANFELLWGAVGSSFGSLGQLPDLRGEFVRGWDDGREVDKGREMGSKQKGTAVIVDPNRSTVTVCTPINRVDKSGGNLSTNWLDLSGSCGDIGVDHVVNARDTWPNLLNSYQNTTVTSGSAIELHTGGFGTGSARPRNVALLYCIKY